MLFSVPWHDCAIQGETIDSSVDVTDSDKVGYDSPDKEHCSDDCSKDASCAFWTYHEQVQCAELVAECGEENHHLYPPCRPSSAPGRRPTPRPRPTTTCGSEPPTAPDWVRQLEAFRLYYSMVGKLLIFLQLMRRPRTAASPSTASGLPGPNSPRPASTGRREPP